MSLPTGMRSPTWSASIYRDFWPRVSRRRDGDGMKLRLRPVTIQGRLLALFVVAAALPLTVVSLISYHNSVESVEKMVGNRTSKLAVSVGDDLSEKLSRRLGDTIFLFNDPVQNYLESLRTAESGGQMAARMDLVNYMMQLFRDGEYGRYYREIILADANGIPMYRGPRGAETAPAPPGSSTRPHRENAPAKPTQLDTLITVLPGEEIPLPGQFEKMAKMIGRSVEALRQQQIDIQTERNETRIQTKIQAEAYKEFAEMMKDQLGRPGAGSRDQDLMGPPDPSATYIEVF